MQISDSDKIFGALLANMALIVGALVTVTKAVSKRSNGQRSTDPEAADGVWLHRRATDSQPSFTQQDRQLITDLTVLLSKNTGHVTTLVEMVGDLAGRMLELNNSVYELIVETRTTKKDRSNA